MNLFLLDLSLWRFPASLILAVAFLLALWAADHYFGSSRVCRTLTATRTAILLITCLAAVLVVEGIWAWGLYHTWPFVLLVGLLAASLGLIVLRGFRARRDASFLLNHTGLFLILWGALFGAPDVMQGRMIVRAGQSESLAYTAQGEIVPLPFTVHLDRFTVDYYDDGITPRQFRSELHLDNTAAQVEVNAPVHYAGYTLYQDGYDTQHGSYTVLLVVRDRWLWVVWLGVALLAAGALLLLIQRR